MNRPLPYPRPAAFGARRWIALILVGALATSQAACTTGQENLSREDKIAIGVISGFVLGGVLGYQMLGSGSSRMLFAAAGAAGGAYGGKLLAERLTQYDKTAMHDTAYNTLTSGTTGETATWQNANTGTHGSITPTRTFLDTQGRICREYDAQVSVEGQIVQGRETACKTDAGHWVVYPSPG